MDVSQLKFRRFHPLRATEAARAAHAEVALAAKDFILPLFVVEGHGIERPLETLVGTSHRSLDRLPDAARAALAVGVDTVLLFGVVDADQKTPQGEAALRADSLVARAVAVLKREVPEVVVITDVCLCGTTDHGHCGCLQGDAVDNDATLPLLAEMALVHARAGADLVAPSAMMDGQVAAIRARLDEEGFTGTRILSYSAKFASKLYGPFRDAAGSAPSFGDRKSYQLDARSRSQGLDEAEADLEEGADWLMVKPATLYLDVLAGLRSRFPAATLTAYHTSGETMMLRHGAAAGLFRWEDALLETLVAIKRAGADRIISYDAVEVARLLNPGH